MKDDREVRTVFWLLAAASGFQRFRLFVLGSGALVIMAYGMMVLLQDVFEVLRPDGASCQEDSNCMGLCHHPALRPDRSYCSSDCRDSGHCGGGMQCKKVSAGWRCTENPRAGFGAECGEDSDCLSERCVGFYATDSELVLPAEARPEDFRGGFCTLSCQDRGDCPPGSPCREFVPNTVSFCMPLGPVERAERVRLK